MVKTLNITLSDEDFAHAKKVKQQRNLTWPEFVRTAAVVLEDPSGG